MSVTKLSSKVHKWLALLMVVQILFWFVSGLFFAVVPIQTVRSEHTVAKIPAPDIPINIVTAGLQRLEAAGATPGDRIEVRSLLGKPVALVSRGKDRPRLYDLSSSKLVSPLPRGFAVAIAERDQVGEAHAVRAEAVLEASPEYRGALPAWRVDFEDGTRRSIYVAQDTGAVTARRSTLWRVYDFLWSLHIMDFKQHEDFNTPLLIGATALGLVVIVTGIVLFPSRLGYTAWRRRRRVRT